MKGEKKSKDLVRRGSRIEDAFYGTGKVMDVMCTRVRVKFDKPNNHTEPDGTVVYDNLHFNTFCKLSN